METFDFNAPMFVDFVTGCGDASDSPDTFFAKYRQEERSIQRGRSLRSSYSCGGVTMVEKIKQHRSIIQAEVKQCPGVSRVGHQEKLTNGLWVVPEGVQNSHSEDTSFGAEIGVNFNETVVKGIQDNVTKVPHPVTSYGVEKPEAVEEKPNQVALNISGFEFVNTNQKLTGGTAIDEKNKTDVDQLGATVRPKICITHPLTSNQSQVQKSSSTSVPIVTKFISNAELVRNFNLCTPERFHSKPAVGKPGSQNTCAVSPLVVKDGKVVELKPHQLGHHGVPLEPRPRKFTEVQPFSFEQRHKELQKQKEEKIKALIDQEKRAAVFRANPVPRYLKKMQAKSLQATKEKQEP